MEVINKRRGGDENVPESDYPVRLSVADNTVSSIH
jgi:hypothetical protein